MTEVDGRVCDNDRDWKLAKYYFYIIAAVIPLPQLSSGGSLFGSRQLITYARRTRNKLNNHSFAIRTLYCDFGGARVALYLVYLPRLFTFPVTRLRKGN